MCLKYYEASMYDTFSASEASVASEASEKNFWVFLQMCFPPQPRESGGGTTPQWGNVNRKPCHMIFLNIVWC